jgi:hypothetical protein
VIDNVFFIKRRGQFLKTIFIIIELISLLCISCDCNRHVEIETAPKIPYVDSAGFKLNILINAIEDNIRKGDTSKSKSALLRRMLDNKRKHDKLDSLLEIKLKLTSMYNDLYIKDTIIKCLRPKYDIFKTLSLGIYDKEMFYSTIIRLLFHPKAFVYSVKTVNNNDNLIQQVVDMGWPSSENTLADGTLLLCFDSTKIWVCDK